MPERATLTVLQLLARERQALRQGTLAEVLALAPAKEAAIAVLPATLPTADRRMLRDAAARNGRLLQAAISGLQEVTGRKSRLTEAVQGFQHYQADGRGASVATTRHALEQRR